MKTIRVILAGLMLIGNPAVWLGIIASSSVRWVLPAFVASLVFSAKTAYAKKFHTAQNEVIDLRKVELSDDPSDSELGKLRVFEVPLTPSSAVPIAGENHDLAAAIKQTFADEGDDSYQNLEDFVTKYPQSRWVLAVELNRGLMLYRHGYFTKVVDAYQRAWTAGKTETQKPAVDLADRAVAELMQMNCRVGRLDEVKSLMAETQNIKPGSVAAFEINRTKQAIWHMEQKPGSSFLCGPYALREILTYQKAANANDSLFTTVQSPNTGFSLDKLLAVSDQLGMNMQMAKRKPGAAVIVPAVVNWKLGHYAALVEQNGGSIHSMDPTFRNETWLTTKALDDESSGYFLVPAGDLPEGWEAVSVEEGSKVFGKGYLGLEEGPPPSCNTPQSNSGPGGSCPSCSGAFMPIASIDLVVAGLMLKDTPLFYTPPVGPAIRFSLQYHQNYGNDMPTSNFGTNWAFSWQGYVHYDIAVSGGCSVNGGVTQCSFTYTPYNFQCFTPGGGGEVFTPGQNSVFTNGLYQVAASNENLPTVITCQLPDGSVQTYGNASIGSTGTLLLTQVTDPQGNSVNLTYDSMNRISFITDAIGQSSGFSYTDTDPYKITEITDPFGQTAVFQYNSNEDLQSITDLLGLTTSFAYGAAGALSPDWPASMTTPYGTTYFDYTNTEPVNNFGLGEIEITDPLGLKEHARFSISQVTDNFGEPAGALSTNELTVCYWDKKAMEDAPMSAQSSLSYNEGVSTDLSESYFPAASQKALESPAWYVYPGQYSNYDSGVTCAKPTTILRNVIESNGSLATQISSYTYNSYGLTTNSVDPKGRELNYTYASNGIDLIQTTDGDGDVLNAATYNTNSNQGPLHVPLTTTDAAGQVTTYSYNGGGQITSMMTPMHETTSYNYDSNGYLLSVVPPQLGSTVSYTYDTFGRVKTKTDAVSGTITYSYDSGNRLTQASYPDGTHESYNYDKLDLQSFTDRQNRVTSYSYDADRRKISMTDPKMQTTTYGWCACGSMTSMTDPKGNKTSWDYDFEGRVTTKTYNDSSFYTYQYSPTENLLTLVTDPKHQQTQYLYDVDDKLLNVTYQGGQVTTPSVSYQYDMVLGRLIQMTDGTGRTTYDYYPIGQQGGNQIQEISQPVGTSTANITYGYDNDGRVVNRSIDGVSENYSFNNAELTNVSNPLGSFNYTYDSSSARLTNVAYPNGQSTSYTYFTPSNPNGASGSLQTLTNTGGGSTSGQTLSAFSYTYKPTGEIVTWQQQLDNTPSDAKTYTMGYDADSELQGVTLTSGTSGFDGLTANQSVTYGYDASGNRTTEYTPSFVHTFTPNGLNQLSNETDKPISIVGATSEPASVLVNNNAVTEDASNYYRTAIQPAQGGSTPLTIQATTANGTTSTQKNHIANTVQFQYDANGNLLNDGQKIYTWDAVNRLVGVSIIGLVPTTQANNVQMSYDGKGRRVSITELHGSTALTANAFVWCGDNLCEGRDITGHTLTKQFFDQGEQISGTNYYFTFDHLDSVREMVNDTGNVQARYDYDVWGRQSKIVGDMDSDFGFTGFYFNHSSGLYLTWHRAYDAVKSRWLTRDPLEDLAINKFGANQLNDLNLYSYVDNDPIDDVDTLGLCTTSVVSGQCIKSGPFHHLLESYYNGKDRIVNGYKYYLSCVFLVSCPCKKSYLVNEPLIAEVSKKQCKNAIQTCATMVK